MPTFNGHKNWNHWNVALWIGGDETMYRLAQAAIRLTKNKDGATRCFLSWLDAGNVHETPDGAPYTFSTVRAALRGFHKG